MKSLLGLIILLLVIIAPEMAIAEEVASEFDWSSITGWLMGLAPWVKYIFWGLGGAVLLGSIIDAVIDDSKDKGFMKYVLSIPLLGGFLKAILKIFMAIPVVKEIMEYIAKFSPSNNRDK